MILAGSKRLHGGIAIAAVVLCSLVMSAGASAKKVTSLQTWKPTNHYLVTADLDGRTHPRLNPVAKVNYLHQGQWVKIACQTTGQAAYGSTVWTRVGGLYVPDTYVKTYTSGMVAGVPRCGGEHKPPPSKPPPGTSGTKVTSLQTWKPTNHYLVTADLDGRTHPRLNPVAKVNYLHQGQWVKIACQTTGQLAYGSRVWTKVRGLYVPDTYIKTYTDGILVGVPQCGGTHKPSHPPLPSPSHPSRAVLAAAVHAVEYERVYGSNYRIYKARYPHDGIIWANDGCSVPAWLVKINGIEFPLGYTADYYKHLFEKSCDRHDFGYRNYGSAAGGLALDPTEARRKTIDERFHANMDYQCKTIFSRKWVQAPQRAACYGAAEAFYQAVRKGAASHFF